MSEGRNVVHEELLWRQRLEAEVQMAETWQHNWGFLGERPEPPLRGCRHTTPLTLMVTATSTDAPRAACF